MAIRYKITPKARALISSIELFFDTISGAIGALPDTDDFCFDSNIDEISTNKDLCGADNIRFIKDKWNDDGSIDYTVLLDEEEEAGIDDLISRGLLVEIRND